MLILGFNKTTLLDYPGHVAATVFTGGCNFRCPFCHNASLVLSSSATQAVSVREVLDHLNRRKNVLQGVCITGGEPLLQPDIREFAEKLKSMGYLVKLDTNGYEPEKLRELLHAGVLDYVAMDIKNSPAKYPVAAGCGSMELSRINASIELLKSSGAAYEFRTTVVRELHEEEDILAIAQWIKGCPQYYLQQYRDNENVIKKVLAGNKTEVFHSMTREEMASLAELAQSVLGPVGEVKLRGID